MNSKHVFNSSVEHQIKYLKSPKSMVIFLIYWQNTISTIYVHELHRQSILPIVMCNFVLMIMIINIYIIIIISSSSSIINNIIN